MSGIEGHSGGDSDPHTCLINHLDQCCVSRQEDGESSLQGGETNFSVAQKMPPAAEGDTGRLKATLGKEVHGLTFKNC